MILLDTDIAIDILRKHPPAIQWIASVSEPLCMSGIVAFELYQGCYNKNDVVALRRQLSKFSILWPSDAESAKALATYASGHLALAVGILDGLIAATALTHGLALNTFNQKHFAAFPDLTTIQPYVR